MSFTLKGQLTVINDANNNPLWSYWNDLGHSAPGNIAQLEDDGNFVIYDGASTYIEKL